VCEVEPKAAIDDAESDDGASKPDVSVRPEGTALVLLEKTMVHVTKNWLEEDQDEKHNANDRMSLIELLESERNRDHIFSASTYHVDLCGKIDTNSKCRDEEEICNNLDNGMEPKKSREAEQSDADGSKRKEYNKSQRRKNTMSDHSALGLFKITTEGNREACRALTKS
jgi:hypothetical protein